MKILIVNNYDTEGGAARAAYRLHQALLAEGIESQMLVQSKLSDDFTVNGPQTKLQNILGKLRPPLDRFPIRIYKARTSTLFSPGWLPFSSIIKRINSIKPDVVHLHWVAGGMIRIEDLAKINAPIVWSLHDMWAFTGGCHYDEECGQYKKQCGVCPVLGSNKQQDASRIIWKRKKATYENVPNLSIIGLSRWLADCARQSSLFKRIPVFNLPNPINTTIFAPFDKRQARVLLSLPLDKKLILFGAMGATSDPRKGFQKLSKALMHVSSDHTELVIFGSGQPKTAQGFNQKVHYLGRLNDNISLRLIYSAADVMVVPSLQENLSNSIMESLSCGTPVIGFSIGGNCSLIEHRVTGYLAKPFDSNDLAHGIDSILNSPNYAQLSNNARKKVLREFDSKVVAKQYIDLYKQVIKAFV